MARAGRAGRREALTRNRSSLLPRKDVTTVSLARLLFRLFLGRRLPRTRGTLTVPGLLGPLRIHRDGWGIPHIEARHDADAHFGVGFCHGQDRAFQLELLLRIVRGTLSEMVGPAALPVDRLSRRIG